MDIIIRGFVGGKRVFEETINADEVDLADVAETHAKRLLEAGEPHMIEIEFPDEPDPLQRFFRMGTDPTAMVQPIPLNLD